MAALASLIITPADKFMPLLGWHDARVLAASTNEAATPPVGANKVRVVASTIAYARANTAAAIPAADIADGTASVILPATVEVWFDLAGVTGINLIAAGTPVITLDYFS